VFALEPGSLSIQLTETEFGALRTDVVLPSAEVNVSYLDSILLRDAIGSFQQLAAALRVDVDAPRCPPTLLAA